MPVLAPRVRTLLCFQPSISFPPLHSAGKSSNSNFNSYVLSTVTSAMEDADALKINKKKRRVNSKESSLKPIPETEIAVGVGDIEDFSRQETLTIRASLLQWYYENQRVLPWRKNQFEEEEEDDDDGEGREARAYAVWVSEVMLQQTRVAAVIDYYNRWMEKWPTVHDLALASQDEVNEMWAGLGYYRRARFLLEGAKMIVEGGEFPKSASTLRSIRGIGDYTAGAIASIAFKEAVPVVDGNVVRVLARLKAISANPKESMSVKSFWKLAGQLVDPCRPGDFNQALMELGATLCTPLSPSCSTCPVSSQCGALAISRTCESIQVTDYPTKVEKPKKRSDFSAVCVVEVSEGSETQGGALSKNNKFLLVKRPEEGLLAGLWEFPSAILDGEANLATRRKAMDQYLKKSFKLDAKKNSCIMLREDVGEYVHVFTHIRLRMYVELLVLHLKGGMNLLNRKDDTENITWKLVDGKSIQNMGLTSGVRKDGRIWKERMSANARRGNLPVMKERANLESEAGGTKPRPAPSNRLILPSLSAPEHNIVNLLEECNALGI